MVANTLKLPGPSSRVSRYFSTSPALASRHRLARPAHSPQVVLATAVDSSAVLKAFKKLQNGSDMRGVALEGVEGEPVSLTKGKAFYIGAAFGIWLKDNAGAKEGGELTVAIGRDPRLSGEDMLAGLTAGLCNQGVAVSNFGLATTPCMFMGCATPEYAFDGGIMITASHLPFNRNGFKFFVKEGSLEKANISDILVKAADLCSQAGGDPDSFDTTVKPVSKEVDFMKVYAGQLRAIIKEGVNRSDNYDRPLEGFKIGVDAGNGSGGYFATDVLEPLGADVSCSQFLEPDGSFPNHIPNPEEPAAMEATISMVQGSGADLGICFDTDVDRSGVVDGTGKAINSNKYIGLMSAITLQKYPGATIVTDSVTSNGLAKFIADLGGVHVRYKRGYKNVIGKGIELLGEGVDCQLMMETSGHGAMAENYFLDDGAYSAVKTVIEMVRRKLDGRGTLSEMLALLPEPLESREFRLKIQDEDFQPVGQGILADFHEYITSGVVLEWSLEEVNHEGWRVNVDEGGGKAGWLLLRQSLHDPLLVLNVESEVEGGLSATAHKVRAFFQSKGYSVDISSLAAV